MEQLAETKDLVEGLVVGGAGDGNGVWGKGCDKIKITEAKRLFTESRQGIQYEGFGKEVHRKDNSVKRFWQFSESPDSEN